MMFSLVWGYYCEIGNGTSLFCLVHGIKIFAFISIGFPVGKSVLHLHRFATFRGQNGGDPR